MRKEKLEELRDYIKELSTVEVMRNKDEFISDDKGMPIKRKGFVSVESYTYKLANGKVLVREKTLKGGKNGNAAIVLPITKDNNTILIVQPRTVTKEGVCVEVPAGYIELNETPEEAAIRELREETGYTTNELIKLDEFYQDQGVNPGYNHSFVALDCEKKYSQKLDEDEFIRYFECSFDEAYELLEKRYITDIQSRYTIKEAKKLIKK